MSSSRPELEPDPFLSITDIARHLRMDQKTVKKLAETKGLPLAELSEGKKGCFLSAINAWKLAVVRSGVAS